MFKLIKNKMGPKTREILSNQLRVRFERPKKACKNPSIIFRFGSKFAETLNITVGDRVLVFYDKDNFNKILIKKLPPESQESSYKIKSTSSSPYLILQFSWDLSKPSPSQYKLREVLTEPYDDGLLVHI